MDRKSYLLIWLVISGSLSFAQVTLGGTVTLGGSISVSGGAIGTLYIDMSTKSGALSPYPTYNFNGTNTSVGAGSVSYDTGQAAALYTPTGYSYGAAILYESLTAPINTDINNYVYRSTIPQGALLPDLWLSGYIRYHQNNTVGSNWAQKKIFRYIDNQATCNSSISDLVTDCFHGVLTIFGSSFDGDVTKAMQLTFGPHTMNATITQSGPAPTNIVTGVSGTGSVVTVTTDSTLGGHGFLTGEIINASGCSVSGYNVTGVTITATSTTTFTYAGTGTGTPTGCSFFNTNMGALFYCNPASSSLCLLQLDATYKITAHMHFGTLTLNQTSAGTDYMEIYVNKCTDGVACPGIGTEVGQYMGSGITTPGRVRLRPVITGYNTSVTQFYIGNQFDVNDVCLAIGGRNITSISQSGTTVTVNTNHTSCSGATAAFLNGWTVGITGVPTGALNQTCTNVVKVTQDQFTCTSGVSQTVSDSSGTGSWVPAVSEMRYLWGWKLGTSQAAVAN